MIMKTKTNQSKNQKILFKGFKKRWGGGQSALKVKRGKWEGRRAAPHPTWWHLKRNVLEVPIATHLRIKALILSQTDVGCVDLPP